MAKKKPDPAPAPAAPMPPQMPGVPGMMPGMPGMPGASPLSQANPMMAMMQMMQMMMGGGLAPAVVDPSALPFTHQAPVQDRDAGIDAEIIRPSLLSNRIKVQQGVSLGSVLDHLCL